jgi:hypothetical protein
MQVFARLFFELRNNCYICASANQWLSPDYAFDYHSVMHFDITWLSTVVIG